MRPHSGESKRGRERGGEEGGEREREGQREGEREGGRESLQSLRIATQLTQDKKSPTCSWEHHGPCRLVAMTKLAGQPRPTPHSVSSVRDVMTLKAWPSGSAALPGRDTRTAFIPGAQKQTSAHETILLAILAPGKLWAGDKKQSKPRKSNLLCHTADYDPHLRPLLPWPQPECQCRSTHRMGCRRQARAQSRSSSCSPSCS